MGDKTDKLARFIEQSQSLSADLGLEELCRSLASGLMDTELDRCSVVVGTEYNGTVLIAGEEMAADQERGQDRRQRRAGVEQRQHHKLVDRRVDRVAARQNHTGHQARDPHDAQRAQRVDLGDHAGVDGRLHVRLYRLSRRRTQRQPSLNLTAVRLDLRP